MVMHPRSLSTYSRLSALIAVAAVSATGLLTTASRPASHTDEVTLTSAAHRVFLQRHRGAVTGNGRTIFVANGTSFRPRAMSVRLPPRVRARAWTVVDLNTGRVLGEHRSRAHLPQASTLKLLTAVTAVRRFASHPWHRVTRFEAHQTCTCAGLKRGRYYGFKVLLEGMLLPSGNDAAEAIAGSDPRGRNDFYSLMNQTARQLGASDTVARNASGLTATGSHSSARDLVLFLRAALREPLLVDVLGRRSARIATMAGHNAHTVWRGTDYVNMYAGSLGKSGYTTPAKNTLVVETNIGGHRIAVASLGAPGGYSTSGARALTLWANHNFRGLRAVGTLPHS
jgi:D-alanyl-D-alanine carboxypeptidase